MNTTPSKDKKTSIQQSLQQMGQRFTAVPFVNWLLGHIRNKGYIAALFKAMLFVLFEMTIYSHLHQNPIVQLVVVISILPVALTVNYCVDYIQQFIVRHDGRAFGRQGTLSALVGISIYISFIRKPYLDGAWVTIENIGYVVGTVLLTFILADVIARINLKPSQKLFRPWELIKLMAFPLVVGTVVFLGVYPGAMSADSIFAWTLVQNETFNNVQPLMYMMLIKGLTALWNSPAILSIFQILLVSFTFGYAAYRLNHVGVGRFACYFAIIVMTLLPANLLTNATLWKDIPYTMGLILFSVEVLRILTDASYFKRWTHFIPMVLIGFFIAATRHNGLYVMILFFVLFIIYFLVKHHGKQALKVLLIFTSVLIVYFGVTQGTIAALGDKYEKENSFTSTALFAIPVQGLISIYYDYYDDLDNAYKERLYNYLNISEVDKHIEKYSDPEWDVQYWRFQGSAKTTANAQAINEDKLGFAKTYYDFFKLYPWDLIASYMRSTGIVWSSSEYGFTSSFTVDVFRFDDALGFEIIRQKPVIPIIRDKLRIIGATAFSGFTNMLFWRPALMMLGILVFLIASRDKWMIFFVAAPAMINQLSYFASCEGQCTRYIYANYTMVILIALLVVYRVTSALQSKQSNPNESVPIK